jgi:hypothetical protein
MQSSQQQQQQVTYPYMSAAGQLHVDPSSIPARPWAAAIGTTAAALAAALAAAQQHAAAAAAAAVGSPEPQLAAGDWQVTALVQCIAGVGSSTGSSTGQSAGATPAAAAAAAASWDDAFVQQVLSAVQVSTAQNRQSSTAPADGSRSSSVSSRAGLGVALQQEDLGSLAQLHRSRVGSAKRQQQQQQMAAVSSVLEQQQQQLQIPATQQAQQQQTQSGGSIADARILQLLSIVKEQQQQQQRSVLQSGQGWGYYGTAAAAAAAPCLQRAQWLAEEISRVQYNSSQTDTSSTTGSSSSVLDSSSSSTALEQQEGAEASSAEVLPVLYAQLQQQLISHLSQEVSSWQDVARVYEVFGEHLNPGIVCWCLTALQRAYRRGLVPPGPQKQAAMRLLQQLLRLVWHWQQQLAPRVSCWGLLVTKHLETKLYKKPGVHLQLAVVGFFAGGDCLCLPRCTAVACAHHTQVS